MMKPKLMLIGLIALLASASTFVKDSSYYRIIGTMIFFSVVQISLILKVVLTYIKFKKSGEKKEFKKFIIFLIVTIVWFFIFFLWISGGFQALKNLFQGKNLNGPYLGESNITEFN